MKKITIIFGMMLLLMVVSIMVNRDYKIDVDDGTLYGTLNHESYERLVLFISGSGPTDRHSNSSMLGGRNDSIKELSLVLNKNGISTFAYDKRSSGKSVATFKMDSVSFNDFIQDGQSVLEEMISLGYEEIYIVGHSQGALIAEILGQRDDVSGIVALNGTVKPIDEVLIDQFKQYDAITSAAATDIINQIKKEDYNFDVPQTLETFFAGNNEFLYSWMAYKPIDYLEAISDKCILIYGGMDTQVNSNEATSVENDYKTYVIEDMNHVLKTVRNTNENTDSYINPIYQVNEALVDIILEFVL